MGLNNLPAGGGQPAQQIDTVWSGWQELEQCRDGQLVQRRTFGRGLDEVVRLESDEDLNGTLETQLVPHYDDTGNLAVLTGLDDEVVGRYATSPFGEDVTTTSDVVPPKVDQLAVEGGHIVIEFSEEVRSTEGLSVSLGPAPLGFGSGAVKSTPVTVETTIPVQKGRQAGRRWVITPDTPPAPGTEMVLEIPSDAERDLFLNDLGAPYAHTFTWPDPASGLAVLDDTSPPVVEVLRLRDGALEIAFSEPVDLTSASSAILVDGAGVTWSVLEDGYTLRADSTLSDGSHTVQIAAGTALDRAGQGLVEAFAETINITSAPSTLANGSPSKAGTSQSDADYFVLPDPNEVPFTAFSNRFAFHGRPMDVETGLYYFRNRYYDPGLGRFITADPLGYVDGPSMYQFVLNDPANLSDPYGLYHGYDELSDEQRAQSAAANAQYHREAWSRRLAQERTQFVCFLDTQGFDWSSHEGPLTQQAFDYYQSQGKPVANAARWAGIVAGSQECDPLAVFCNVDWETARRGVVAMEAGVAASLVLFDPLAVSGGLSKTPINIPRVMAQFQPDIDDFLIVYHGTSRASADAIRQGGIDLNRSRLKLDFGRGFYTTDDPAQAARWAARNSDGGEVLAFRVRTSDMQSLRGLQFESTSPSWARFVRHHRLRGRHHSYDFVRGPTMINPRPFLNEASPRGIGQQTAWTSERSVELLMRGIQ